MASEDKFAKTIGDDELDNVAGGTQKELQKDIAFLNKMGCKLDPNADAAKVRKAWYDLDIGLKNHDKEENSYLTYEKHGEEGYKHTRQNAMIWAMRKAKQVVDLDEYL